MTLLTVGYGDIVPGSLLSQIIVMFIIIFTLFFIPKQTNELIRLMNMQSKYKRYEYVSTEVHHICVTGYVGFQALQSFCQELYHADHGGGPTNTVIIQNNDPTPEMELFLDDQKYKIFLTYLAGNPLNSIDLKRCDLASA